MTSEISHERKNEIGQPRPFGQVYFPIGCVDAVNLAFQVLG